MNSKKTICGDLWSKGLGLIAAMMLMIFSAVTVNAAEQPVPAPQQVQAQTVAPQVSPTEGNVQTINMQAEASANTALPMETIDPAAMSAAQVREYQAATLGYTPEELKLLASIIWCEAGNQPFDGQVAVGSVVMNRIKSEKFPNTISTVIYERRQFEPVSTGWLQRVLRNNTAPEVCYEAALYAMAGCTPVGDSIYFERKGRYPKGITIAGQCFWGKL